MSKKQFRKHKPSEIKGYSIDEDKNLSIDFGDKKKDKFAGGQTLSDSSVRIGDSWVDLKTFISEGFWLHVEDNSDSDPTEGYLKFNNNNLNLVTEFYISSTSQQGVNFNILLGFLSIGSTLEVKQFSDFSKGIVFSIKSITNNGSWIKFGIYIISVAGNFDEGNVETIASLVTLPIPSNRILITQFNVEAILSEPIDSTKEYFIDGVVDLGDIEIMIPVTGLELKGYSFDTSRLISSENNYKMLRSNGGTSGNVLITDLRISVTGTNSQVFQLIGDSGLEAIEANRVNYVDCTSLGTIDNYRQGLELGTGRFGGTPELELIGTWVGGFRISTSIARDVNGATLFKAGIAFIMNGRFLSDINMEGETNASLCDFSSSNIVGDGLFAIIGANFKGVINPFPNITGENVKSRFRNNIGIRNTYVGSQWTITSEVATILTSSNPNKLAGTTTYVDEQWFSNVVSNAFIYDSDQEIEIEVRGTLSLSGSNGNEISFIVRQWDDSASNYIDLSQTGGVTMNAAGRAEGISILGFGQISKNDRIELWIENLTNTNPVTALLGGLVSIQERPS